jgi:hypothetical protein
LKVTDGEQDIAGLRRSFSLESGGSFLLQTAPGDPHGQWTFTVTDGITGSSGSATVEVAPRDGAAGPGFVPLGWPSEIDEPASMPPSEFLSRLGKLAELYRTDQGSAGWLAKQRLGAHYEFFPGTRHSLLRPLYDVEWTRYVGDLRDAILAGGTFVLAGEDVGVDPATGLATYPHLCAGQLPAVAAALHDAQWRVGTRDGETLIAQLGRGQMILCRESVDAAGHTNADAARWQQRWLAELADAKNLPAITAPNATRLGLWWAGRVAATDAPRTVAWFGSNHRELELVVDPSRPLDGVFTFTVPPSC